MYEMVRPRRWPLYLTLLGVGALIAIGAFLGLKRGGEALAAKVPDVPSVGEVVDAVAEPEPYERISPAIIDNIRALADLTTVEYLEHTTIEKGTDGSWLRWARGDGITLFAVAEIGAGVDLAELEPASFEVDPETGVVTVALPRAEIQYASLDNDATQVFDRSTGIFTQGNDQLETEARQLAEEVLLQKALDSGILEEAQANAGTVLTNFVMSLGYPGVEFVVDGAASSTSG